MRKSTSVPGSNTVPGHPRGAVPKGRAAEDERRTVALVMSSAAAEQALEQRLQGAATHLPLSRPPHLTAAELAGMAAPSAADTRAVEQFAAKHGLEVGRRSAAQHQIELRGTVRQLEEAFGVVLEQFQHPEGVYLAHRGPITIPAELQHCVRSVIGLDASPVAHPQASAVAAPPAARRYTPLQLATRYRFPKDADGTGQRIAIISFGGGFHQQDLDDYFTRVLRLPKAPAVSVVSIPDTNGPGPANDPFPMKRLAAFIEDMSDPHLTMQQINQDMGCPTCMARALATLETTMDIEIVGAVAPAAAIDVYFANNTMAGWRAAILAAAGIRDEPKPAAGERPDRRAALPPPATVISLSWGQAEARPSGLWKDEVDQALQQAAALGVTVCCAAGDLGSLGVDPGAGTGYDTCANVSCPASSPYALACGGTTIAEDGEGEVAWNNPHWKSSPMATGGGVSGFYERPTWQAKVNVPRHSELRASWLEDDRPASWTGRGVPDVAANADAASGYELYVGGRRALGGGTSAAAPLWAGLVARLNQRLTQVAKRPITLGHLTPLLYRDDLAESFVQVREGNNRLSGSGPGVAYFRAGPGWNPCTGLGVPHGERLLEALSRSD